MLQHPGESTQLVCFTLGDQKFAIDIMRCLEILRARGITAVPDAPGFVVGILSLRGHLIPCIDLAARFGLSPAQLDRDSRLVIVEVAGVAGSGPSQMLALLVGDVALRSHVRPGDLVEPPALVVGIERQFLGGVLESEEGLILKLDVDRVLSSEELERLVALERAETAARNV